MPTNFPLGHIHERLKAMKRSILSQFLSEYLNIGEFQDYGPNGLQIEGTSSVKKIAFAVSATADSIKKSVEWGADALIVHHGLFWKFHGPKTITGPFAKRVKPLIQNDINLFGYHLPLDAHPISGNARAIADLIDLGSTKPFGERKGSPLGVHGHFQTEIKASELKGRLEKVLNHPVLHASVDSNRPIKTLGIITGGANSEWTEAKSLGLDAYLTGEMSEHDWHEAPEAGVDFYAGGHNATERFGVQQLQKIIGHKFSDENLETKFFDSENPA